MMVAMIELTRQHDAFRALASAYVVKMGLPFLQLLELPTSAAAHSVFLSPNIQDGILKAGNIHGVVYPDLPPRSLLSTLLTTGIKIGTGPRKVNNKILPMPDMEAVTRIVAPAGCMQVHTVAAQLRNMRDIQKRLITSAQFVNASDCGGSLLLVSGGHPFRRFPIYKSFLPGDSFAMLRMASMLRQGGEIPAGVQLWAVENPLTNTVDTLEQKILAGAETVILQPPLLQERFSKWWDVAHCRGLVKHIPVVVGLPLISSADSLEFWFGLTKMSGEDADSELDLIRKMEDKLSMDVRAKSAFFRMKTLRLVNFIKSLPGVAGIHIMPVTPSGWRQFDKLQGQVF